MSITAETCKEHAKDPAVLCCRAEAGITIGPENLEIQQFLMIWWIQAIKFRWLLNYRTDLRCKTYKNL